MKSTGTIRLDPESIPLGKTVRTYAPLNNKCMELRKVLDAPMVWQPPLLCGGHHPPQGSSGETSRHAGTPAKELLDLGAMQPAGCAPNPTGLPSLVVGYHLPVCQLCWCGLRA